MRTDQEIINYIYQMQEEASIFDSRVSTLIPYLPFAHAQEFLKDDVTENKYAERSYPLSREREAVLAAMKDYMSFAWDKANHCRGLSAARTIDHMRAWLWLLEEDDASKVIEAYTHYGKPQLRAICEHFNWDWRVWDNGQWGNSEGGPFVSPDSVPAINLIWTQKE